MQLKESIAITPTDKESILNGIKEALNRGATKILFDKVRSSIRLQRPIIDDEVEYFEETELLNTIRLNTIEEFEVIKDPLEFFFLATDLITKKGFYLNFILVNNIEELNNWLEYDLSNKQIFSHKIYINGDLEKGTIILAASPLRIAEPSDIIFSVKGYIDVEK